MPDQRKHPQERNTGKILSKLGTLALSHPFPPSLLSPPHPPSPAFCCLLYGRTRESLAYNWYFTPLLRVHRGPICLVNSLDLLHFRERKGSGIFCEQSRDYLYLMEFLSLVPLENEATSSILELTG